VGLLDGAANVASPVDDATGRALNGSAARGSRLVAKRAIRWFDANAGCDRCGALISLSGAGTSVGTASATGDGGRAHVAFGNGLPVSALITAASNGWLTLV
jgi:hypothetical protein